jgi:hypothetical protein
VLHDCQRIPTQCPSTAHSNDSPSIRIGVGPKSIPTRLPAKWHPIHPAGVYTCGRRSASRRANLQRVADQHLTLCPSGSGDGLARRGSNPLGVVFAATLYSAGVPIVLSRGAGTSLVVNAGRAPHEGCESGLGGVSICVSRCTVAVPARGACFHKGINSRAQAKILQGIR